MKDFDAENHASECTIAINCRCNTGFYSKIDIHKAEENIGSHQSLHTSVHVAATITTTTHDN